MIKKWNKNRKIRKYLRKLRNIDMKLLKTLEYTNYQLEEKIRFQKKISKHNI